MSSRPETVDPTVYQIRVKGSVDRRLARSLGMSIADVEEGTRQESVLFGPMLDQAALIGILNALYDYGFSLLSVECQST